MNRFRFTWISGVLLAFVPVLAFSADLTVHFTGKFIAPTCGFSATNANLQTWPNTYFNTNASTPTQTVTITATQACLGTSLMPLTIHMTFGGTADSHVPSLFAVNGASGVSGVGVELLANGGTTRISPNTTSLDWTYLEKVTIGGNDYFYTFPTYSIQARFTKTTGAITAGTVNVPITINFTYN